MKSLDEIKSIAATYSGGPIVLVALRDAIMWAEAYREVAINQVDLYDFHSSEEEAYAHIDAEAQRILEERAGNKEAGL